MIDRTDRSLADLAERLRALPPSLGPVRLVAVDGHAGSGKTTFAARLAAALDDAPVLHTDDLASHAALFDWQARLLDEVLEPLGRGAVAHYAVYDWHARRFAEQHTLPPAPVVIIEGVGAGRREVRPYLACLLWMELAERDSWHRGQRRDGPGMSAFWAGWFPAERAHFAADPSRPHADALVFQPTTRAEGYRVLPGPGGTI
ncbi:hypothetical protein AB0F42_17205 [Streptomyces buecherae]|uniref:uridine kinase family protein n=1 Tax=Streptomyces buecherae TaxID=2763006 RepID=UPI0033D016C9